MPQNIQQPAVGYTMGNKKELGARRADLDFFVLFFLPHIFLQGLEKPDEFMTRLIFSPMTDKISIRIQFPGTSEMLISFMWI